MIRSQVSASSGKESGASRADEEGIGIPCRDETKRSRNKIVLITGASRGIGRAAARLFARSGYDVAIHYHQSEESAEALRRELAGESVRVTVVRADVSDRQQVDWMAEQVGEALGEPDVLVCCAGIAWNGLLTQMPPEEWRRLFAVNVDGPFFCCRAVLPAMIRRHSGKIVLISSMWGQTGASCEVAYSASKAAVIGLTRALAKEVGPSGIQVNCVAPGVIDTDMLGNLEEAVRAGLREETPLGVLGTPEDVAASILFLASPGGDFYTGQVLSPNGGFVI